MRGKFSKRGPHGSAAFRPLRITIARNRQQQTGNRRVSMTEPTIISGISQVFFSSIVLESRRTPSPLRSSSPAKLSQPVISSIPFCREEGSICNIAQMDSAPEIAVDVSPFYRIHKGGFVERFMGTATVSASEDDESVASRDVVLDPRTGVFVRLFLPRPADPETRLPVVLYVHGGGFSVESAASARYHDYLCQLAREAAVICASVDYRRAPEHRLPAAYDDCFSALEWLRRQAEGGGGGGEADTWLRCHADFARCYVMGDSAGANIVHNLGVRAGKAWGAAAEGGLRIRGAIAVHPFFAGKERIAGEPVVHPRWALLQGCLPEGEDEDYWGFNPVGPRSPGVGGLVYPRVLVVVAAKDYLKDRGVWYYRILRDHSGKRVELLTTEDEGHVFHLKDPHCENARLMMTRISDFIHSREA